MGSVGIGTTNPLTNLHIYSSNNNLSASSKLIIQEFNLYSNKNKNSEQFFEKSKIIYGLNINKNFKKIKSLFLQAL